MKSLVNLYWYSKLSGKDQLKWSINMEKIKSQEEILDYLTKDSPSFESFIINSFSWSHTSEGYNYWQEVMYINISKSSYSNCLITNILLINKNSNDILVNTIV